MSYVVLFAVGVRKDLQVVGEAESEDQARTVAQRYLDGHPTGKALTGQFVIVQGLTLRAVGGRAQ
jgi:hypothetical protein